MTEPTPSTEPTAATPPNAATPPTPPNAAFFHPCDDSADPVATGSHGGSRPAWTGDFRQRFLADDACIGPWSAASMHGGPPSALLVRACERAVAAVSDEVGLTALRACIDFLAPVPVGEVTARARVLRGGRRVSLAEAVLEAGGQEVLHARTWLLRSTDAPLDDDLSDAAAAAVAPPRSRRPDRAHPAHPAPSACPPALTDWAFPYARAVEWRHVSGDPGGPGDAAAWARPRIPLVAGEQPTGLQRAVLVADSGNGISAALDWGRWTFVNIDLVVHLSRPLEGEWVLLDARTRYEPGGTGLSSSVLHDESGAVGTGAQTLLVSPR